VTHEVSLGVAAFVALLGVTLVISIAAERARVPAAVLLVGTGAIVGSLWHVRPPFAFGPAVLFVFLPPLIFEAAWNIDRASLFKQAARISLLAVPGTLLTAFAVAGIATLTGALPFGPALLLGSMIAATDPVAVVAVFRKAAVPQAVKTLVEAESLSNDGVAVVLYGLALALLMGGDAAWLPELGRGALEIAGGAVVGIACAFPLLLIVRGATTPEYEVTATLALAYVSYLLADRLGLSGIFATAAAAIALRGLLHRGDYMQNRDRVDSFWNVTASIANGTVFLATGLLIDLQRAFNEPLLFCSVIAALILSRIAIAAAAGGDRAAKITVFLAGMRGALPLALALALPENVPQRAAIVDGVFVTVIVTLVLQGLALEPVVKRLYGGAAAEPPV
jgi:CPA1 family monovalent cation:H+ antiporter